MPTLKGKNSELAHLVLSASDIAQVEGMLVLSSMRGVAESILAMASDPQRTKDTEAAVLSQLLTLREMRDELKAEFEAIEMALTMTAAFLTNSEVRI